MLWNGAFQLAEPVLRQVVDRLAEQKYAALAEVCSLQSLTAEQLQDLVTGYLMENNLPHIDPYNAPCHFKPKYEYHQASGDFYNDNSGFWLDYDLTTDSQLNDLTLQMSFLFGKQGQLKPFLLDIHVL